MQKYNPKKIERKWQTYWQKNHTYKASDTSRKKKKYVLVEFPYPSGAGLHMGHLRSYTAADVYSRYFRLKGFEVMYPMGWDAFGLPAENYAIKHGVHPRISTAKNISNFTKQIHSLGYGFDWSREVNTTDPKYYQWTQWIFLQLFKKGLAYEAVGPINWCPKDKCGLANEEVVDGKCDRCGTVVEKREMRQWFLKITAYAEKLLEGLKHLPEWPDAVKLQQENWIGKSTGAEIEFRIANVEYGIKVFTTRPDTIFGATYLVVAPEHGLVTSLLENKEFKIKNLEEVKKYIEQAKAKSEIARTDLTKEKTGVELKGVKAVNPATKEEIPVWVADYVLGGYGTGAIMAVPAHDERDFEFARKFGLQIRSVIAKDYGERLPDAKSVQGPVLIGYDPKTKEFMSLMNNGMRWLVGGGLKDGETFEEAALRELKEEAGFSEVKALIPLGDPTYSYYFNKNKNSNRRSFSYMYLAVIDSKQVGKQSLEEHENFEVVWSDLDSIVKDFEKESTGRGHWIESLTRVGKAISSYEQGKEYEADIYTGSGILFNSGKFSGMETEEAKQKMAKEFGKPVTQYKLRDWLFSRQRYWGEPIPIVHCAVCVARVKDKGLRIKDIKALPELYFSDQKIWADVVRGYKTVDTRAVDPKSENKDWAKIMQGDVVALYNKKARKRAYAKVTEVRNFKTFAQLFKAGAEYVAKIFPGQKFKSPVQLELAYKKIYKGYPNQIDKFGLTAWSLEVLTTPVALKEKDLPLKLPEIKKYLPTGTGESPLATASTWVNTTCPVCKSPARRETNTMPQWAGSSWYWLRYTDPKNAKELASKAKLKRWTPVDVYFGGMEHTTLHLLYSRFWNQFLYDQKVVTAREPYAKRVPHGIILAADGVKMSKSLGNVVNPDEIVKKHGADAARMYELFLGPHEAQVSWNDQGVVGVRRFLERVWGWGEQILNPKSEILNKSKGSNFQDVQSSEKTERALHKLIKKVGEDIEDFKFNTCVSSLMEFLGDVKDEEISPSDFEKFLVVLYSFAPHISEELYQMSGGKGSLQAKSWPKFDPKKVVAKTVEVVVQVNGKVRSKLQVSAGSSEQEVVGLALKDEKIKTALSGSDIKKQFFVQDRLLNLVV